MTEEYSKDKVFASLPRTTRGLPLSLSASPDGTKFIYCNGNSIFIREVDNITDCDIYTEHSTLTTAAKYANTGYYIASGDQSGKVRIWDTTQSTHILKAEYPIIGGPIRDIAWNDDSKRVAVVGEGRERFGHVFLFDTGTSNGNLSGQSRSMTSIDFKPTRPYRLVSTSEDNTVAMFEGPPFKFKTVFREHSNFAQCVRYNKDGTLFASCGSDGKIVLYEGADGAKNGELIDEDTPKQTAHSGGVFTICWSPDGSKIVSSSGDKTVKIWNVSDKKLLHTVKFPNVVDYQQLAVVWLKTCIVSVSLAGFLHYIDYETGTVTQTLKGHNKPLTALTLSNDKRYAFTSDFEGNITRWDINTGSSERAPTDVHKSQVSGLAVIDDGTLISVGWDDFIAFTNDSFGAIEESKPNRIKLSSQPRGIAASKDGKIVVIAGHKSLYVFIDKKEKVCHNIGSESTCISLSPDNSFVAVGFQDSKVRIFKITNDDLVCQTTLTHSGCITSVNYSNDGKYLAVTDAARKVVPYDVSTYTSASEKEWTFHTARVNCCAWSPNNRYIATGSLDTNIMVWDMEKSGEHPLVIKGAHAMSSINAISWLSNTTFLSIGQDSNIKQWSINVS
uniref:WD_REPEATS_REGION domain-containing protein n=1 Tax=Parastrongyloides trichosuri TaxID=131310 RepID=A0A0N4ZYC6_PARTI